MKIKGWCRQSASNSITEQRNSCPNKHCK